MNETSTHGAAAPPTGSLPGPTVTPVSQYFWDSADDHRLVYQRCARCDSAVFPPRAHCCRCWSVDVRWHESAGHGVLASTAVVHRPGHPAFTPLAPYPLVLVDLQEGFRMLSRLVDTTSDTVAIGTPLRVCWETYDDVTLPLFTETARMDEHHG